MKLAFLVANALLDGDFASHFARIPSAAEDPEAIVLRDAASAILFMNNASTSFVLMGFWYSVGDGVYSSRRP